MQKNQTIAAALPTFTKFANLFRHSQLPGQGASKQSWWAAASSNGFVEIVPINRTQGPKQ